MFSSLFKARARKILYSAITTLPKNKTFMVDNNRDIIGERIPSDGDNVTIRVEIKNKSQFEPHVHDCVERVSVRKGAIEIVETGEIRKKWGYIKIPARKVHTIKALEPETIIYIEFKKS